MCIGDEDLSCKRINTFITIIWTQSCLLLSDDVCLKEIATTCAFLISPVPIAEPLTSELIDTPVFHNLAPGPIKYQFRYPSLVPTQCFQSECVKKVKQRCRTILKMRKLD